MMDHGQMIRELYSASPSSALLVDERLSVVWTNQSALDRYPVLSLPSGLSLLFSQEQLAELMRTLSDQVAHTVELAGITRVGFCFAPIDGGYFVSIGSLSGDWERPAGQSADFLASTITNQLKTPLSHIFSGLFAMARLPESEPGSRLSELIEQVNRSSYQMLRFSINFNAYLQDMAGNRPFYPEMLDLTELLEQVGNAAKMLTETVGIKMRLSLPPQPVCIEADERRLSHVLLHLISNCCRFTRGGNEIELTLETSERQARLSILDRGCGIPADVVDRVCDPFFSYNADGLPYAGGGLGLSLVRHVISQHGGSFALSSTEGEGTKVAIGLPLCEGGRLTLKSPEPLINLLSDRFSLVHVILSDCCGVPKL